MVCVRVCECKMEKFLSEYLFPSTMLNQLTFTISSVGSSSGVKARDDFRWPSLPVGALAKTKRKKKSINGEQETKVLLLKSWSS